MVAARSCDGPSVGGTRRYCDRTLIRRSRRRVVGRGSLPIRSASTSHKEYERGWRLTFLEISACLFSRGPRCCLLSTAVLRYCATAVQPMITVSRIHLLDSMRLTLIALCAFDGLAQESLTLGYLLGNGYRHFFPALQRFGSPDDLSPFHEGGINAYAYCSADPKNFSDPDGHALVPKFVKNIFTHRQSSEKLIKTLSRGRNGVTFGAGGDAIYSIANTKLPKGQRGIEIEYYVPTATRGHWDTTHVAGIPTSHIARVPLPKNQTATPIQLTRPQLKSLHKQYSLDIAQNARLQAQKREIYANYRKRPENSRPIDLLARHSNDEIRQSRFTYE